MIIPCQNNATELTVDPVDVKSEVAEQMSLGEFKPLGPHGGGRLRAGNREQLKSLRDELRYRMTPPPQEFWLSLDTKRIQLSLHL